MEENKMSGYRKYFTLSYDDGVIWDIPFLKIINDCGLKATFNLNSGLLGQKVDITQNGITFNHDKVDPEQVRALYAGHEIATHAVTHPNLCSLSDEEIRAQICGDREALSALAGYDVCGHAYPGGAYDELVAGVLAQCGIRYARTIVSTHSFAMPENLMIWHPTCYHQEDVLFDLADEFLRAEPRDSDLLFYVWGHTYEFNIWDSWDRIRRFCEKMAGHPDITYATNLEIAERAAAGKTI